MIASLSKEKREGFWQALVNKLFKRKPTELTAEQFKVTHGRGVNLDEDPVQQRERIGYASDFIPQTKSHKLMFDENSAQGAFE